MTSYLNVLKSSAFYMWRYSEICDTSQMEKKTFVSCLGKVLNNVISITKTNDDGPDLRLYLRNIIINEWFMHSLQKYQTDQIWYLRLTLATGNKFVSVYEKVHYLCIQRFRITLW